MYADRYFNDDNLDAQKKNIQLDQNALEIINRKKERLITERNLRFITGHIDTSTTAREDVAELEGLYFKAE